MSKVVESSAKYQYFATICVNILTLSFGTSIGWSSPFLPVLQSTESPLQTGPITLDEASWIGSLLCVGAIFGTLLFGWMAERFGRKLAGFINALPQIAFWLIVLFGTNVYELYLGRFLAGLAGGGTFVLVPLYVAEIAEDRIRGALGSILIFAVNLGTLVAFTAGTYLSYRIVPCVMLFLPIVFLVCFIFFPETPQYLMKCNRPKDAEQSLRYFRNLSSTGENDTESFRIELDRLNKMSVDDNVKVSKDEKSGNIEFMELFIPTTRKAIFIGIALIAFNQLSGCFALINYTAAIFADSGSTLSPNVSAIIIGVIQILGSWASIVLVERFGRKILYIVSSLGTAIGLSVMATYAYLKLIGFNVESFSWLPVVSLSFVIFIASVGILPLTFVVLSELLPQRLRGIITTFCICILYVFSFIVVKYFGLLLELIGIYGAFWLFSICCFIALIFFIIFVPETKGKSFEEILELMR